MKLTVIDGYTMNPGDISWAPLERFGELKVFDHYTDSDDEVIRRIGDAEIVLANKSRITRKVLDACPNIKFIAVQATGYNSIDCAYAAEKGIAVSNVPTYGTAAVAQYAISMLLEVCGRVAHHSKRVHEGAWQQSGDWCFWDYPIIELAGKTIGVVGFGRIGRTVGKIASALGMKVLAYNRSRCPEGEAIAEYVELDELFKRADVISLHAPLNPGTAGLICKENIAKMKDGVIIINNSRGGLIAEQDLADALVSGKVYAAALDVVSEEPIKDSNPLYTAPNCFITPHISWAPKECRERIINTTVENIEAFLAGKPINKVN